MSVTFKLYPPTNYKLYELHQQVKITAKPIVSSREVPVKNDFLEINFSLKAPVQLTYLGIAL